MRYLDQMADGLQLLQSSLGLSSYLRSCAKPNRSPALPSQRYVRQYRHYVGKFSVHFDALSEGPVRHYLSDVFLQVKQVPDTIEGECVQCGNCCLNKRCAFLEPVGEDKFQCGIYNSPFRKLSNCGAFPISGEDIERYECPGYVLSPKTVIKIAVVN